MTHQDPEVDPNALGKSKCNTTILSLRARVRDFLIDHEIRLEPRNINQKSNIECQDS